jgi:hypothetical protein
MTPILMAVNDASDDGAEGAAALGAGAGAVPMAMPAAAAVAMLPPRIARWSIMARGYDGRKYVSK